MRPPLRRLRLRLTAWYLGAFVIVLLVSRVLLFGLLAGESSRELDRSLRDVVRDVVRATAIRLDAGEEPHRAALESVREMATARRPVHLLDASGATVYATGAPLSIPRGLVENARTAGVADNPADRQ